LAKRREPPSALPEGASRVTALWLKVFDSSKPLFFVFRAQALQLKKAAPELRNRRLFCTFLFLNE
jgi:hypothetical protein